MTGSVSRRKDQLEGTEGPSCPAPSALWLPLSFLVLTFHLQHFQLSAKLHISSIYAEASVLLLPAISSDDFNFSLLSAGNLQIIP